jgi:DNA ligase 1
VHVQEDGTVQVYSRNLENTTSKYPDIVARMPQAMAPGVKSVVLDGEVQAWDTEKKVFLPFQVLTTRKRKDVAEEQIKVQVLLQTDSVTTISYFPCGRNVVRPLHRAAV